MVCYNIYKVKESFAVGTLLSAICWYFLCLPDFKYRKIGENPRESWRMVPDSHPAIISWELFDEVSTLREAAQAVRNERKKRCRERRENNPNIFKGRILYPLRRLLEK